MLIQESEINSIKQNKTTFVKNFIPLKINYDFNFLSQIFEKNNIEIKQKTFYGHMRDIFQIRNVSNLFEEIKPTINFLGKSFSYEKNENDEIDLFFSFVPQTGVCHWDEEDVFIIGLEGKVIYKIFDIETKYYAIEKGDMIFIPKPLKHTAMGLSPRITASVGFCGRRINE